MGDDEIMKIIKPDAVHILFLVSLAPILLIIIAPGILPPFHLFATAENSTTPKTYYAVPLAVNSGDQLIVTGSGEAVAYPISTKSLGGNEVESCQSIGNGEVLCEQYNQSEIGNVSVAALNSTALAVTVSNSSGGSGGSGGAGGVFIVEVNETNWVTTKGG